MKKQFILSKYCICPGKLRAFTLLEMLVVIGIISVLVVALVPVVRGVREKAKESAVKQYCASIDQALATYAASHDGNFPGVAIDVMSPFPNHALGDPQLYSGSNPPPGGVSIGVLGGTGSAIASTKSVYQLLKEVKDTPLNSGTTGTPRYFDSLISGGAIDEYPKNPFKSSSQEILGKMINIFRFEGASVPANGDPSGIVPYLLVNPNSEVTGATTIPEPPDSPYAGRLRLLDSNPSDFRNEWDRFFNVDNYFAPGDFAYVPILSNSAFPPVDNLQTLENDAYRWGTLVSGYMLFGYGWQGSKTNQFEEEKQAFQENGLPGYGGAGADTPYEQAVLALFNGAVYFSKKP